MKNGTRLAFRMFALGMLALFGLASCGYHASVKKTLPLSDEFMFIQGMNGCENLCLMEDSFALYVTDLGGSVHLIDGQSREALAIVKSLRLGEYALGIVMGPDGFLYAAASGKDWMKQGGGVYKIGRRLEKSEKMTGDYRCINGLAMDGEGTIYFASGTMDFFRPSGSLYAMRIRPDGKYGAPEIFLPAAKAPNGMFIERGGTTLFFTETFDGVSRLDLSSKRVSRVSGKSRLVEGFDDLCVDRAGRVWVGDPPNGFIKCFDPAAGSVTRYMIRGCGVASSCRIRMENGEEILYVTEIKRSTKSKRFDGRGVLAIPLKALK